MKKLHLAIGASLALCVTSVTIGAVHEADIALRTLPATVQGVDYRSTLATVPDNVSFTATGSIAAPRNASKFTLDDIQFWAGSGSKSAGLVVQWNCAGEENALVFGYHWDGRASGADMIKAIAEAHPLFYALLQYTNVSSDLDPLGGYTINGMGWDADEDGDIFLIDTGHGDQQYDSETGFFEHPRGYKPGSGGSSDYDYDNWKAGDKDDYWKAGWFSGFWSYWVGDDPNNLAFSSLGASGRELSDGSWDGWNYEDNFNLQSWKPLMAAPNVIPADAKTEFVNEGLCYTLVNYDKSTVAVAAPFEGQAAYSGEVTIPATFTDGETTYTVVSVANSAFAGSEVTKVTLPASITSIGDEAFKGSKLADINISDAVTKLGKYAFASTAVTSMQIPSALTEISEGLYMGSSLTECVIPAHVTAVATKAFADCKSLATIELHKGVTALAEEAFAGCGALKSVSSPLIYPIAITESVFSDAAYADATLYVPGDCEPLYAKATGWQKFAKVSPVQVEVPANTGFTLGNATFKVLPTADGEDPQVKITYAKTAGITSFANIKAANTEFYTGDVVIPAEVSFQGTKYKVTALSDSCFLYAAATSISLPDAITEIPFSAFAYSSVESVKLPASLTKLNKNAFNNCKALTAVELPEGVTELPQYAFNYCTSITSVTSKSPIRSMEMYAFKSCTAIKTVPELAEGMTEIPQAAFQDCNALTSVKLPSTITKIGNYAFSGCKKLAIDFPENVTSLGSDAFTGCESLTKMVVNDKITALPNNVFKNCTSLAEVEIPANVKTIGNYALSNTAITTYEIPATVTSIGTYLFYDCKKLTHAVLPASLAKISASTFRGCQALTDVQIKKTDITSIEDYTFADCRALKSVIFGEVDPVTDDTTLDNEKRAATPSYGITIPDKVTKLGSYAFSNCTALTINPAMPSKLTTLGTQTFANCSGLTDIELPEGFKTFGNSSFKGSGLTKLVVPTTVTSVASSAFSGATNLKLYFLSDTPPTCYSSSFTYASGKYVPITVPSGMAGTYSKKSTYWKNATPVEPELAVTFGEATSTNADGHVTVTTPLAVDYADSTHPSRFLDANEDNLATAEVTFRYKPVTDIETAEPETELMALADESEATEVPATLTDGKLSAEFDATPMSNTYTGTWVYNLGTTTKESEPILINLDPAAIEAITETADNISYADGILSLSGCPGQNVAVITIDGRLVKAAATDAASGQLALDLPAGSYIIIVGNSACKIAVK